MSKVSTAPVSTRLHLVRHCDVRNPRGVLYGHLPDFPLSEKGVRRGDTWLFASFEGVLHPLRTTEYDELKAVKNISLDIAQGERDIDRRPRIDLQHDAGLHVGAEPLQRDFQPVGTDGQVRHRPGARGVGDHGARESRGGLRGRHGDARKYGARRVSNDSCDGALGTSD